MDTPEIILGNSTTNNHIVFNATFKQTSTVFANNAVYAKKSQEEKNTSYRLALGNLSVFVAQINNDKLEQSLLLEDSRRLGAQAFNEIHTEGIHTTTEILFEAPEALADLQLAFLEGFLLSSYEFTRYKTNKGSYQLEKIVLNNSTLTKTQIAELVNLVKSVFKARDLVNTPVINLSAPEFSQHITEAGKTFGFETEVLGKAAIESLKMGGLLGVNAGSIDPPTFNILSYKPENAANQSPLVLVGKGIVYDTGGYNIKVGGYMNTMKSDMGGGAAVVGALSAIASNELPLYVVGLIPATDNRIGKNAIVADDVITISDGTTVEVKNTDAEGRLVLADALVYAKKYNPELVIDLATLTGAAEAITSYFGIAMVHDADDNQVQSLGESGEQVYERLAELPFWREYDELLKSDIADMSNLGGPKGGAITAGKFLHHFTDYNWIHLDVAGPAFVDSKKHYMTAGGTGAGVRILYDFAKKMSTQG